MDFVPLREHIEEIRLITILPPSPDGLVHCRVKAVSLKDTTAAYRAHTLSPHLRTIPKTEELSTWNNATARSEISNTEAAESPSPSQFRFEWGDYACLSYFWGDQKVTSSIVANGAEIQVTTNLEACLRVLQKRLMFDAGFKLWIDAICINQADTAERGRQISKMRDLYTGGMVGCGMAWAGV